MVEIISYGISHGELATPPTVLIPCHDIPNPHTKHGLRELDGTQKRLQFWVMGWPAARATLAAAEKHLATAMHPSSNNENITVAFECYGGKHRSASLAEILSQKLTKRGIPTTVTHRDLYR